MHLPARLTLTLIKSQLELGRTERVYTSKISGPVMKKSQRLSNLVCCLVCSRTLMRPSQRATPCGISCQSFQLFMLGIQIQPTFMSHHISRTCLRNHLVLME